MVGGLLKLGASLVLIGAGIIIVVVAGVLIVGFAIVGLSSMIISTGNSNPNPA